MAYQTPVHTPRRGFVRDIQPQSSPQENFILKSQDRLFHTSIDTVMGMFSFLATAVNPALLIALSRKEINHDFAPIYIYIYKEYKNMKDAEIAEIKEKMKRMERINLSLKDDLRREWDRRLEAYVSYLKAESSSKRIL